VNDLRSCAVAVGILLISASIASAQVGPFEWQELGNNELPNQNPTAAGFGHSADALGDIDGDGVPDFAVGAPNGGPPFIDSQGVQSTRNSVGQVRLIQLDACGDFKAWTTLDGTNLKANGLESSLAPWFGASVAHVGDVTVQGQDFKLVAVGAPKIDKDDSGVPEGGVFVYSIYAGGNAMTGQMVNAPLSFGDTPNLKIVPGYPVAQLNNIKNYGTSVAGLGDLDGNGGWGLAVGDPEYDGIGRVWVHRLNVDAAGKVRVIGTTVIGDGLSVFGPGELQAGDEFGVSVAGVGDLDGDGVPDLAVGARKDDALGVDWGDTWILFLNPDTSVREKVRMSSLLTSPVISGALGQATGGAGDIDGNGVPDLLSGNRVTDEMSIFRLAYGGAPASLSVVGMDVIQPGVDCSGNCPVPGDKFGGAVVSLGDFDGNGAIDLVVGADDTSYPNKDQAGAVWMLWDRGANPWTDLGNGLAGTSGIPLLSFCGYLQPGYPLCAKLSNAKPSTSTFFVLSLVKLSAPFKGGVLVPAPDFILPIPSDASGKFEFCVIWPAGFPPLTQFYSQVWIPDMAGPFGFAASNGVQGTTP